ncbi:MAG: hypothetical protein LBF37_00410 [Rickettsiales bacterium]|jgi:hypothetical protein|nr:hypothetical protein [Rickettsiales bacterium]
MSKYSYFTKDEHGFGRVNPEFLRLCARGLIGLGIVFTLFGGYKIKQGHDEKNEFVDTRKKSEIVQASDPNDKMIGGGVTAGYGLFAIAFGLLYNNAFGKKRKEKIR